MELHAAAIHVRIVPPAPISMSSECAPRHRTESVCPGSASRRLINGQPLGGADQAVAVGKTPGHATMFHHVLKRLPVAQRIHRPPEAGILECQQLVCVDQPAERLHDQLLPLAHVV